MKNNIKIKLYFVIVFGLYVLYSGSVFSQENKDSSYFPLALGNQWIYIPDHFTSPDTVTIIDTQTVNGKIYYAFKHNNVSAYYWYRKDNDKIYIVDSVTDRIMPSNFKESMIYDFSANLRDKWDVQLKDIYFSCDFNGIITLENKKDTLSLPAGKFKDCYSFSRVVLCRDAGIIMEWYSPGVGLISYHSENIAGLIKYSLSKSNILEGRINGVESHKQENYKLSQNYPNPFNPMTQIDYSVTQKGNVSLKVYNLLGEEVAILYNGMQQPGNYSARFDGSKLSSGMYLYQLKTNSFVEMKKLMLLK
jgi:hypothetical protein